KSVFITRINSDINTINDIKCTKLSFGIKDSTQWHLIPRIILKKNNIYLTNLKHYQYTGSHQECAEAVLSGRYDVCAMQEKLAKKLARQGLVKIIHTSSPYPSSGIAVSSKVPNDIVEIVQKALLEFQPQGRDKEGMYHWEYTEMPLGFVTATSKDYDELRVMANQFRLLDEEKSSQ
ncbi:MAG TPA: phosphate/phosphite/phosphonate ABC transporter substrate-binding protein, partial [Arcobacter sp.]|nr:phosphate/phosphite/phosphonate ABC transporter substrate-binding protein [Arcobacter sp.]